MKKLKIKVLTIVIFLLSSIIVGAQEIPNPMSPPRLVNDFAGFLSSNETASLEQQLRQFNNETSTQIVIVIVKSLDGADKAMYATELAEKWGIGQKGKDNGLLILVKPNYNNEKGEVFIATGYGLEGVVPDAIAKRIVENEILPNFKQGRNYQGLQAAVNTLMSLTKGEFTADEYRKKTKRQSGRSLFPIFFILFIIIISSIGGGRRGRHHTVGGSLPFWIAMGMMGSGSRGSSGSFGNFSSGGGGFGGFGGGSFGGGGAGGSW
ncbi:MAG: TPM domain-containing protein [Chlorobi bacterium]|nr:TPM domain-containing protein [Chlorobiota bacterium]